MIIVIYLKILRRFVNMLNFGILGPGRIAETFAKAMVLCDEAKLYAVASRDIKRAEDFANKYSADIAYGDYVSLLKDENVDIVYISVVHNYHVELAKLAIEHGKAVICEKPMAVNVAEIKELVDFAKEKKVLLMEAMWTKFLPCYKKAKEWIKAGKIGELKNYSASFSFKSNKEAKPRLFDKNTAGGALFDVGCYTVVTAMDIIGGYPKRVEAVGVVGDTGVDEFGSAVMLFENGSVANISFGINVTTNHEAVIYGTNAKIVLDKFWRCTNVKLLDADNNVIETFTDSNDQGFLYEIQHICELYKENKKQSDVMTFENSIDAMRVMDKILNDIMRGQ